MQKDSSTGKYANHEGVNEKIMIYDLGLISGTNDKTLKKYNPRCQKTVGFKFIKSDDSGPKLGTYKRLCYKVMTCKIINNVGWPCRRILIHLYIHVHVCKHASLKIIKQITCL